MPEEVGFFGRTSLYGLAIATVYWFVSYDVTGTALLAGFGLATGVGFVLLWRRSRTAGRAAAGSTAGSSENGSTAGPTAKGSAVQTAARDRALADPDRPFSDESGAVPLGSFAPLQLGIGIAVLALGLVFGIWFAMAATIPIAAGALAWVREARHEHDLVAMQDRSEPDEPPGTTIVEALQARADRASGDLTAR